MLPLSLAPPQTIISLPVHTAVWTTRPAGAPVVLVAVQLSVLGLYLPASVQNAAIASVRPRRSFHCRSTLPCDRSGIGRAGGAGGCPTIGAGIISAAGVQKVAGAQIRPRRSFRCRSTLPCDPLGQRACLAVLSNCRCWDYISRRCSNKPLLYSVRPKRSFHCRSTLPCELGHWARLVVLVAVQLSVLGLYLPPVFKMCRCR